VQLQRMLLHQRTLSSPPLLAVSPCPASALLLQPAALAIRRAAQPMTWTQPMTHGHLADTCDTWLERSHASDGGPRRRYIADDVTRQPTDRQTVTHPRDDDRRDSF